MAPDGTTPWKFIRNTNYSYIIAGENLAKDFYDVKSMVEAWMDSKSHKDNILTKSYKETGVALKKCKLTGVNTTIVVQMFASPSQGRTNYDQIDSSGDSSTVNSSTPVHCPINKL